MSKTKKPAAPAAERADKHALYLKSVQSPENEVEFFEKAWRDAFGGDSKALALREDFCGTFAVCCEWVKSSAQRTALGVDLDSQPLDWGREHLLALLTADQQQRVTLLQEDVRHVLGGARRADILAAQNFSFWVFKTRESLREYFRAAYENLNFRGLMVLDMMGGSETLEEDHEDLTHYRGYDYIWDQARFDPITHDCMYHIHFRFKDGSALEKAFTYHWRFWTIPEVTEVLLEAGFREVHVYWEGTDQKTGEGNDIYERASEAASDPAWVCYMVAIK